MRPERARRRRLPLVAAATAEGDDYAWLMTFSDLVLQLFAFVVVCAVFGKAKSAVSEPVVPAPPPVAQPAAPKVRVTQARRPVAPMRPTSTEEPARVAAREPVPARVESTAARAEAAAEPAAAHAEAAAERVPTASPPATALRAAGARLQAAAGAQSRSGAIRVSTADDAVVVALQEAVGFTSASADLPPAAAPILAEVRRLAAEMPAVAVEVVGHTDDRPIESAAYPSNLELSLARAARVARELTAGDAELATRVSASGAGPYRPVASNADPEGRARNRRVEIRLVPRRG